MFKNVLNKIIIFSICISIIFSCKSVPVTKDSEPYRDFGTPLVGHYVNKEYAKGISYTISTLVFLLASLLFAPVKEDGTGIIPIDKEIAKPLTLSFLGVGGSIALIASPIDTSISYQIRNKKIIELNQIEWSPKNNITKYDAINAYRAKIKLDQIEIYRKKFKDETITEKEVYIVWDDPEMSEALKEELDIFRKKQIELKIQKEKELKEQTEKQEKNNNEKIYQEKTKEELEKELEQLKKILEEKRMNENEKKQ